MNVDVMAHGVCSMPQTCFFYIIVARKDYDFVIFETWFVRISPKGIATGLFGWIFSWGSV